MMSRGAVSSSKDKLELVEKGEGDQDELDLEENTEAEAMTLDVAAPSTLTLPRSSVPAGVQIKWFQRKEMLTIEIAVPGCENPEVSMTDGGEIKLTAKDPKHCVTLHLLRRIHTSKSRWFHLGRVVKLELWKAEYGLGHWNQLVVGEKLPNVLIDWTSWIDEAEETEIRNNPYGHDTHHMIGAMGANWGSNVDRKIKATAQAAKLNTSRPDDPDEDITCV